MRLEVEVPHVAGLEHQPDDLDARQLVRWHVNSEFKLLLGLAKVGLEVLVTLISTLPASVGSLGVVVVREACIVCRCLDLELLE